MFKNVILRKTLFSLILSVASIYAIKINSMFVFDLKLKEKTKNKTVYRWAIEKANKNVNQKIKKILQILDIEKKEFSQKWKNLHEEKIKKEQKETQENKTKRTPTKVVNAVKNICKDPEIKRLFGIQKVKAKKTERKIITPYYPITILNDSEQPSIISSSLRHIFVNYNNLKDINEEIVEITIKDELATMHCNHFTKKLALLKLKDEIIKNPFAAPEKAKAFFKAFGEMQIAMQVESYIVSIFNNLESAKLLRQYLEALREIEIRAKRETAKIPFLGKMIKIVNEIINEMTKEENLIERYDKKEDIGSCWQNACQAYTEKKYAKAAQLFKNLLESCSRLENKYACKAYTRSIMPFYLSLIEEMETEEKLPEVVTAINYLEQLANQYYEHEEKYSARYLLANIYYHGLYGKNEDEKKALDLLYSIRQQNGNLFLKIKSIYFMGKIKLKKTNEKDIEKGFYYLLKAATQNKFIDIKIEALSTLMQQNINKKHKKDALANAKKLGKALIGRKDQTGIKVLKEIVNLESNLQCSEALLKEKLDALRILSGQKKWPDAKKMAIKSAYEIGQRYILPTLSIGYNFLNIAINQTVDKEHKQKATTLLKIINRIIQGQKQTINSPSSVGSPKTPMSPLSPTHQTVNNAFVPNFQRQISPKNNQANRPLISPKKTNTLPTQQLQKKPKVVPRYAIPLPLIKMMTPIFPVKTPFVQITQMPVQINNGSINPMAKSKPNGNTSPFLMINPMSGARATINPFYPLRIKQHQPEVKKTPHNQPPRKSQTVVQLPKKKDLSPNNNENSLKRKRDERLQSNKKRKTE